MLLASLENVTGLIPIPIRDQIRSTDVIVHGVYTKSNGTKSPIAGVIVKEHSLKLISIVGINHHKIVNKLNFKFLTYEGHQTTQHKKYIPQFRTGEEVVLFLKSTGHGYTLNNNALGKYKIVNSKGKKYLVHEVFPENENLSNLSFAKVNTYIEEEFGNTLSIAQNRFIYKGSTKKKERLPASLANSASSKNTEDKQIPLHFIWPLMALGLIGFYYRRKGGEK